MLSNREKMLVALAYYQGACDNVKVHSPKDKHEMLQDAAMKSADGILIELGISMPDISESKDLYDFMWEMEEITKILCKEKDYGQFGV